MKTEIYKKNLEKATEICDEIVGSNYLKGLLESYIQETVFSELIIKGIKSSQEQYKEFEVGVVSFLDDYFIEYFKDNYKTSLEEWLYEMIYDDGEAINPDMELVIPVMLRRFLIVQVVDIAIGNFNKYFYETTCNISSKIENLSVEGLKRDDNDCQGCEFFRSGTCLNYKPGDLSQNKVERYLAIQLLKEGNGIPKVCPRLNIITPDAHRVTSQNGVFTLVYK